MVNTLVYYFVKFKQKNTAKYQYFRVQNLARSRSFGIDRHKTNGKSCQAG